MKADQWKCPLCGTINSGLACRSCAHVPEYYLPLDAKRIRAEKLKPLPGVSIPSEPDWRCAACGEMNPPLKKKCQTCGSPREPRVARVRVGLLVSVFLIGLFLILLVFVGKLVTTVRPEVLSGQLQRMFTFPTPSALPSLTPIPTQAALLNPRYPDPPQEGCVLWSQITPADVGQVRCVYGLVYDTYIGEPDQLNIRFSEPKDAFRMVMMNALEPPDLRGLCVYQTGEIKQYGNLLYLTFLQGPQICEQ